MTIIDLNITMLGVSGSGKTALLGSLLDSLTGHLNITHHGFYLQQPNINANNLFQDTQNLNAITLRSGRWPEGTQTTSLREMSLYQGQQEILRARYVDYRGGVIRGERVTEDETKELTERLMTSHAIMVVLDASRISDASLMQNNTAVENNHTLFNWIGLHHINNILHGLQARGLSANLLFVLTQCDQVRDDWKNDNFNALAFHTQNIIRRMGLDPQRWNIGLVPTSAVGMGAVRRTRQYAANINPLHPPIYADEITQTPQAMNVVEAFFWLVSCRVSMMVDQVQQQHNHNQNQLHQQYNQHANLITDRQRLINENLRQHYQNQNTIQRLWNVVRENITPAGIQERQERRQRVEEGFNNQVRRIEGDIQALASQNQANQQWLNLYQPRLKNLFETVQAKVYSV